MFQILTIAALVMVVAVEASFVDLEKTSDNSEIQAETNFALAVNGEALPADLVQEGQSSDVVVRAKRYYGCGCGCGCATVAAVSVAPCGYGCCGCGYGK